MEHKTNRHRAGYTTFRGTVVMDEVIYYIQDFALSGGLLHINATAPGPVRFRGGNTEFSVHGPDGYSLPERTTSGTELIRRR